MMINLQLTAKSSPADGMLAKSQSRDFETLQSSSFGEILKVEEKKLQQEQELSAASVAAILAAMQTPLPDPKTGLEVPTQVDSETTAGQPTLQTASVKPTTTQPLQSASPNTANTVQNKTVTNIKLTQGQNSIPSTPNADAPQITIKSVEKNDVHLVATTTKPSSSVTESAQGKTVVEYDNPASKSDQLSELHLPVEVKINDVSDATAIEAPVHPVNTSKKTGESVAPIQEKSNVEPQLQASGTPTELSQPVTKVEDIEFSVRPKVVAETISAARQAVAQTDTSEKASNLPLPEIHPSEAKYVEKQVSVDTRGAEVSQPEVNVDEKNMASAPTITVPDIDSTTSKSNKQSPGLPEAASAQPSPTSPVGSGEEQVSRIVQTDPAAQTVEDLQPAAKVIENVDTAVEAGVEKLIDKKVASPTLPTEKPGEPSHAPSPKLNSSSFPVGTKPIEIPMTFKAALDAQNALPTAFMETASSKQATSSPTALDPGNKPEQATKVDSPTSDASSAVKFADGGSRAAQPAQSENPSFEVGSAKGKADAESNPIQAQAPVVEVPHPATSPAEAVVDLRNDKAGQKIAPRKTEQETDPTVASASSIKEATPVKAPEKGTTVQVNTHATEVVQQIMNHITARIKNGETAMRLQINPKDMGAIEVHMVSNKEGVSVTFFAEQAGTGQLLETQMDHLRQSLKDAGVQLTNLNVSQHDQPRQEGGFQKQDPHFGQVSQRIAQAETVSEERTHLEQISGSSNEVDYLI